MKDMHSNFFHIIRNTALSQAICVFKLETQSFTHLLPVMPFLYCFKGRSHTQSLIFFLYFLFPISALFSDTPLRILQINSLHLTYWDLDHWTSRSGSVVPENLQSHRLCYPRTGDPVLSGLQHPYLRNNSNTTESLGLATVATHHFPNLHSHTGWIYWSAPLDTLAAIAWKRHH